MKVAVIGGIAFAVGLAGGTGIGMRGGNAPTPSDSTKVHADSGAAKPDSGQETRAPDSAGIKVSAPADSAKHESTPAAAAPTVSAPAAAPVSEAGFDAKQLADAVGKLSPADAAPLLSRFTDDEILATAKVLGMARGGAVIAKLPEPRSTKLSRRLLLDLGAGGRK